MNKTSVEKNKDYDPETSTIYIKGTLAVMALWSAMIIVIASVG